MPLCDFWCGHIARHPELPPAPQRFGGDPRPWTALRCSGMGLEKTLGALDTAGSGRHRAHGPEGRAPLGRRWAGSSRVEQRGARLVGRTPLWPNPHTLPTVAADMGRNSPTVGRRHRPKCARGQSKLVDAGQHFVDAGANLVEAKPARTAETSLDCATSLSKHSGLSIAPRPEWPKSPPISSKSAQVRSASRQNWSIPDRNL